MKPRVLTFSTSGQRQGTTCCTCAYVSGCRREPGDVCCLRCLICHIQLQTHTSVYVVLQFYPKFKFYFPLFQLIHTVESRFLKPSVSRTSRYLEPNLVSLGFASLKLYNFTPDFSNPRFLETPDNSNQFWLPWDKLTLDNLNLRKFRNHLVWMSITFTPFC